uniref:Uncharacterized protein n=1 Tax=Powellomyces hirtus TaxID=109895 RepID=A0A4P8NP63_9FUNG|nr:hypothetical protein [Powellomyces hirtus]
MRASMFTRIPPFNLPQLYEMFPNTVPYEGNEDYWNPILLPILEEWEEKNVVKFLELLDRTNQQILEALEILTPLAEKLADTDDVTTVLPMSTFENENGALNPNAHLMEIYHLLCKIDKNLQKLDNRVHSLLHTFAKQNLIRDFPYDYKYYTRKSEWTDGYRTALNNNGLITFANGKADELRSQIPGNSAIFDLEDQIRKTYFSRLNTIYNNMRVLGSLVDGQIVLRVTVGETTYSLTLEEATTFINNNLHVATGLAAELRSNIGSIKVIAIPPGVHPFEEINKTYNLNVLSYIEKILKGDGGFEHRRIKDVNVRRQLLIENYLKNFINEALVNRSSFPLLAKLFDACRRASKHQRFTQATFKPEELSLTIFFALSLICRILFKEIDVDENLFKVGTRVNKVSSNLQISWTNLAFQIGNYYNKISNNNAPAVPVGTLILNLLVATGQFEQRFDENYYLTPNDSFLENIANYAILGFENLPMVCKPNPWINQYHGGFLTNHGTDLIHHPQMAAHRTIANSGYLEAVDRLNAIP